MLTKNAFLLAVLAGLVDQSAAFNTHRHLHRNVDRRQIEEMQWTTIWETVYVTAGAEAPEATGLKFVSHGRPDYLATATTTVVLPAATDAPAEAPPAEAPSEAPAPSPAAPPAVPPAAPPADPAPPPPAVTEQSIPESAPASPPPSPPPSGPAPSGGKRGLAYNDVGMANVFSSACASCVWAYNWGQTRQDLADNLHFIPTLWGTQSMHTSTWDANCETALGTGSQAVFSFNEPDNAGQANLSPDAAAAGHIQFMNKYAGRAKIGAPSVTNSGTPGEGLDWLKSFFAACDAQGGCQVDFCNVHWYSEVQYADTLFEHLKQANEVCGGRPVWLTEFAPFGSDDQISQFMTSVIPQLDALDYLHGYSYFMVSAGSLMSSATSLSSYGQLYAI